MRFSYSTTRLGKAAIAALTLTPGCGGRTAIPSPPPPPPPPACIVDSDCPGFDDHCQPVTCEHLPAGGGGGGGEGSTDAGPKLVATCVAGTKVTCPVTDRCTKGTCKPSTGECAYTHVTPDMDGDGYYAPLPGYAPGSPGSCGDDCDDTNANAHPGGIEVCDGVDNDCDGIIDNGAVYLPDGAPDVQVSGPVAPATPGGLAWSGQSYAATYTGSTSALTVFLSMLNEAGGVLSPPGEQDYTHINADAAGAAILWRGDRYGMTWQDRRSGNYEIYFSTAGADGMKQIADTRLTFAPGFSVYPAMVWNNLQFLVVWQDDRNGPFDIFAQRVNQDLSLDGDNLQLTHSEGSFGAESPSIASGIGSAGMASAFGDATHHWIDFQVFSPDLSQALTPPMHVTDGTTEAEYPTVVWNKDRYVVAWYDKTASPTAIYAATFHPDGTLLTSPRAISSPGPFQSRYPFLKALGDRVLVVYSDDRDQNDGYELYTRTIHPDLTPLDGETRITHAPRDSIFPVAAFGPKGDFGVLFRDDRENGVENVFFTSLTCHMPGTNP